LSWPDLKREHNTIIKLQRVELLMIQSHNEKSTVSKVNPPVLLIHWTQKTINLLL